MLATFTCALFSHEIARAAAIIAINEPPEGSTAPITLTTSGIPVGVPGITIVSATSESINFTYDDGIAAAVSGETDRVMLEGNGSNSDLFAKINTAGSSVENVFFFSDNDLTPGGGLPAACTPSAVCTVLPPVIENGAQQTMVTVSTTATPPVLLTTYTAASDVEIPEPGTIVLFSIGLAGLGAFCRRRWCGRSHISCSQF
jgi:hypothetical protein